MSTCRLGHGTPMVGVLSITPYFANNPAFLTARVGAGGIIRDSTAYALDLASLQKLGPLLASGPELRSRYEHLYVSGGQHPISEAQFPSYACGTTALDPSAFAACVAGSG